MKKKLSVLLAVVLVAVVSTAAAPSPPTSDRDQVLKVVQSTAGSVNTTR
jgi:cytochrome c556